MLRLGFLAEARNVVLVAAQGLGKTMIAQNIAHAAVLAGTHVLFTTAAQLLLDLGSQESTRALARRLNHYACRPRMREPTRTYRIAMAVNLPVARWDARASGAAEHIGGAACNRIVHCASVAAGSGRRGKYPLCLGWRCLIWPDAESPALQRWLRASSSHYRCSTRRLHRRRKRTLGPAWASCADVGERYTGTLSGAMNMTGAFFGAVGMAIAGRLFHRGLDDVVFLLFACSYGLAALCWLAVDVTKPLVPKA